MGNVRKITTKKTSRMKSLPSINFGSPSLPVHFTFQTPEGENHYLFAFLTQSSDADFDLQLGINADEPDIILRGLGEMDAFLRWLRSLPASPHLNCRPGIKVLNTRPDLAGEHPDMEHLVIDCTVGINRNTKVYALVEQVDRLEEIACYTRWPCSASVALAGAMLPLIEAIRGANIDIRPSLNPLDEDE